MVKFVDSLSLNFINAFRQLVGLRYVFVTNYVWNVKSSVYYGFVGSNISAFLAESDRAVSS